MQSLVTSWGRLQGPPARFCAFLCIPVHFCTLSEVFGRRWHWWHWWHLAAGVSWTWHALKGLAWGAHSPWIEVPTPEFGILRISQYSLVLRNSHWYQYQTHLEPPCEHYGDLGVTWGHAQSVKKPFGHHPSSTGLSLVPTRIVKTGYLPKKLSKRVKETNNRL